MTRILSIAREEWRYWSRSRLSIAVLAFALLLVIAAAAASLSRNHAIAHERHALQTESHETFQAQPDRHPHRMVHYGHYAFKPPPPLGVIDPGVDVYSGNVIFLEGHRQNTAMFAERERGASANLVGSLTPAFVLQVLAPICLILLGYSTITREREAHTDLQLFSQGISGAVLLTGKLTALVSVALLMLIPLVGAVLMAVLGGEAWQTGLALVTGYLAYLLIWCLLILITSSLSQRGAASLMILMGVWILISLVIPSYSANVGRMAEAAGKIESDFALLEELRELGDGHNAADPAFTSFRDRLLETHGVEQIEDLPLNFRGAVASKSEADLTELLRRYAESRFEGESAQATRAAEFGWISPVIAIRELSMSIAGTDLPAHHRFLRETEELRFDFVQGLNEAHSTQLSYEDDINRSDSEEANQRARISASNWQVLDDYRFEPAQAEIRLANATGASGSLLVWLLLAILACAVLASGRRV